MVGDYTQKFYNPAAEKWRYLTAKAMARAKALSMWKENIKTNWPEFEIKDVQIQIKNGIENEK